MIVSVIVVALLLGVFKLIAHDVDGTDVAMNVPAEMRPRGRRRARAILFSAKYPMMIPAGVIIANKNMNIDIVSRSLTPPLMNCVPTLNAAADLCDAMATKMLTMDNSWSAHAEIRPGEPGAARYPP